MSARYERVPTITGVALHADGAETGAEHIGCGNIKGLAESLVDEGQAAAGVPAQDHIVLSIEQIAQARFIFRQRPLHVLQMFDLAFKPLAEHRSRVCFARLSGCRGPRSQGQEDRGKCQHGGGQDQHMDCGQTRGQGGQCQQQADDGERCGRPRQQQWQRSYIVACKPQKPALG